MKTNLYTYALLCIFWAQTACQEQGASLITGHLQGDLAEITIGEETLVLDE